MNDNENNISKCPVMGGSSQQAGASTANQHWFPEQLNLNILSQKHPEANPMGEGFDYAKRLNRLISKQSEKICMR